MAPTRSEDGGIERDDLNDVPVGQLSWPPPPVCSAEQTFDQFDQVHRIDWLREKIVEA